MIMHILSDKCLGLPVITCLCVRNVGDTTLLHSQLVRKYFQLPSFFWNSLPCKYSSLSVVTGIAKLHNGLRQVKQPNVSLLRTLQTVNVEPLKYWTQFASRSPQEIVKWMVDCSMHSRWIRPTTPKWSGYLVKLFALKRILSLDNLTPLQLVATIMLL